MLVSVDTEDWKAQAGQAAGGANIPHHSAAPLSPSQTHTEDYLVNVAYLLVSSAWLAGQPPAPPTTAPTTNPAPIVAGSPAIGGIGYGGAGYGGAGCGCGGGSGGCCDDGCCGGSSWGHRCKNRLRGLFSRG